VTERDVRVRNQVRRGTHRDGLGQVRTETGALSRRRSRVRIPLALPTRIEIATPPRWYFSRFCDVGLSLGVGRHPGNCRRGNVGGRARCPIAEPILGVGLPPRGPRDRTMQVLPTARCRLRPLARCGRQFRPVATLRVMVSCRPESRADGGRSDREPLSAHGVKPECRRRGWVCRRSGRQSALQIGRAHV
jgi:hypothetical protein